MRSLKLLTSVMAGITFSSYILTIALSAQESPASPETTPSDTSLSDFEQQVAPILQSRCLGCHGKKVQEAGLRLDSRDRILQGGDNPNIVNAGRSSKSRLIDLVAGTAHDNLGMPPEGPRLRPEQIEALRRWIDRGLPWPDQVKLDLSPTEIARSHWAFRSVVRPSPPIPSQIESLPKEFSQLDFSRYEIDDFVLARLESERLTPGPLSDRRTLIRRVTLDLIGLPPTPAEVDAFVLDPSPDAYERLVDRLLASPHYGERWARPWLDLCHYGDTDGYLTDQKRPVAWRYRQWLIEALNADLALADFTKEQIAGDLLPHASERQQMGTGFLRNTLSNREGGADLEEYRVEQVVDRTTMVGTAWLGLTVGCARCHDHKFDPISQRDFFSLYAFFNNADEINMTAPLPHERPRYEREKPEHERRRAELLAPQLNAILELQDRWEKRMLQAVANPGQDYLWDRQWEVLGLIWGGELGEGQLEGCQIVLIPRERRTQDQRDRLLDYFLKYGELTDPARFKELKLAELQSKLAELQKQVPPATRAPTIQETATPRKTHLHVRGDFRMPGEPLTSAIPDWLEPDIVTKDSHLALLPNADTGEKKDAELPILEGKSRQLSRLEFAEWLVSAENPLTARVFVNRAWQEFFGGGLVETPDNFGLRGERPSHPELLDWLADEFLRTGGCFKTLHRKIVTSRTYCQSSHVQPEQLLRDPQNRLLARQSPLRLSAEQVRDAALAVSGLLADQIGGPSVFPPQPASVAMEGFDNSWKPSEGSDRNRRGLYTWLQRLSPYAQGITFDAPSNARVCVRRERSNTPLQALTLLNDPIFWEAAQALSDRISRESPADFDSRLDYAFRLVLGRLPEPFERERLAAHFSEQLADKTTDTTASSNNSFTPNDSFRPAAWTSIASILLNLHEFITRE